MQIASAKSQSVREYLTNRLSWVAARVSIVHVFALPGLPSR